MHIKVEETGTVFWITGLAGAGKTSIAKALFDELNRKNEKVVFIDGDAIREITGNDLGHHTEDRIKNAYRISRMCHFFSDQGQNVVCATMSLYHEVQRWNREHIAKYFQIYVKVSQEVLFKRDQKGLYTGAGKGEEKNVVGVDIPFQEPIGNDLVIENDKKTTSFTSFAETIINRCFLLSN